MLLTTILIEGIHGHGHVRNTGQCAALYFHAISDEPGWQVFAMIRFLLAYCVLMTPIISQNIGPGARENPGLDAKDQQGESSLTLFRTFGV